MKANFWLCTIALFAAAPAAAQRDITEPGTTYHRAAGAAFPERVGDFERLRVTQFDAAGHDIGASYRLVRPGGQMVMTIYIYPAAQVAAAPGSPEAAETARAQLCGREFEQVGLAIRSQYEDAEMTEDGAAPAVAGVPPRLALRQVYRMTAPFDDRPQPVRSEADLYCYVGGEWLVKYRATSQSGLDAADAIERFIRDGPWPGRAAPTDPKDIAAVEQAATPS
ncbi:MAG: hypothetical protein ACXWUX_03335 [Allosphingosinicella sp.]